MELLSAAVEAKDLGTRKSATVLSTLCASVVTFSVLGRKNTLFNWVIFRMRYSVKSSNEPYPPFMTYKYMFVLLLYELMYQAWTEWHEKMIEKFHSVQCNTNKSFPTKLCLSVVNSCLCCRLLWIYFEFNLQEML